MKKLIVTMGVVAAMAMGVMAETANTVKVTKFHQSYPYTGKATVQYTVDGTLPANAVAEITINTDDASATFKQNNIVTGVNSHVIDFASSFGGALVLTNASFVVTIAEGAGGGGSSGGLGGVQLWENGPYWAECNVGASKPEDYGYYFWWGDTVGSRVPRDRNSASLRPCVKENLSTAARAVLDAGRELWRYYHAQPNANPDASYYDIRLHFQGTTTDAKGKVKMNPDSSDATYTSLLANLRVAMKDLAKRIEPKVYEYGFLKG